MLLVGWEVLFFYSLGLEGEILHFTNMYMKNIIQVINHLLLLLLLFLGICRRSKTHFEMLE